MKPFKQTHLLLLACLTSAPIAAEPVDWDSGYAHAQELSRAGNHQAGLEAWNRLLAQYPDQPDALLGRGLVLLWLQEPASAAADFSQVVASHPGYREAWLFLGDARQRMHQEEAALAAWRRAQQLNPADPAAAGRIASLEARRIPSDKIATITPASPRMRLGVQAAHTWFDKTRDDWSEQHVTLTRQFEETTGIATARRTRRFGVTDYSVGAALWGQLRNWALHSDLLWTPSPDIAPRWDGTLEATRSLSGGWELGGGMRHLHYPDNRIDMIQTHAGHSGTDWYARATLGRSSGSIAGSGYLNLLYRQYLPAGRFLEATGGFAREEVQTRPGTFDGRINRTLGLRLHTPVMAHTALSTGLEYSREERGPEGLRLHAEYLVRW